MNFTVVIPARYGAVRLPGKPLREIAGRPMIEHVYRRATESGAAEVIIATDDERIKGVAEGFGARVCMTDPKIPSGTDRIADVVRQLAYPDDRIVVNLQGDEPQMPATLIDQVAQDISRYEEASISTLCVRTRDMGELFDPGIVKVVMDAEGYALYFSRAPIPWVRDGFATEPRTLPADAAHYRHIGLYAYRARFLREYARWNPCPLERMESLEQLRALWHARRIHVAVARERPPVGVDTERDLQRVARAMECGDASPR
jgi:3-deoxy-manno-octulosonate cytidylyltransferase (CMP-KDO synthetase)